MALKWIDGFEFLNQNDSYFALKYGTFNGNRSVSQGTGRFFGYSVANPNFSTPVFSSSDEWTIGFALDELFNVSSTNTYDPNYYIAFLRSGSEQFALKLKRVTDDSFRFAILRGTTELGAGQRVIKSQEGWHYIEVAFKATDTGDLELRIDGAPDLVLENVDLQAGSSSGVDQFGFSLSNPNGALDDLYILTGKSFLGEQVVEGGIPYVDRSPNDWTPGGSTSYTKHCDAVNPRKDWKNSYLEGASSGDREHFGFRNEYWVQSALQGYFIELFARLDVAGTEHMSVEGGSAFTVDDTDWQYHYELRTVTKQPKEQGFKYE